MDKILNMIQNTKDDAAALQQLSAQLNATQEIIYSSFEVLPNCLNQLQPERHSLGYLHLLLAYGFQCKTDQQTSVFIRSANSFLIQCKANQIRLEPIKFRGLCDLLTKKAIQIKRPLSVVKTLRSCIWKVGVGDQVTPQHAFFAKAILKAKAYKYALPVLDKFVYEIDPDQTGLQGEDVRLYFYYGGMIYIGLKEYQKALEFFEIVISSPANVGSKIMSEAYKKFILVSLIVRGEVKSLPKYHNPTILRLFKAISTPYEEFATTYETKSVKDLHNAAQAHVKVFQEDGNFGIVKQAIEALNSQNIQRLTKTYITLSLQDIASKALMDDVKEVENRVFSMIKLGKVFATINEQDGMIAFKENPDRFDTDGTLEDFEKNIEAVIDLHSSVSQTDESIATSERYLRQLLMSERAPAGAGRGYDAMDISGSPSADPRMGNF